MPLNHILRKFTRKDKPPNEHGRYQFVFKKEWYMQKPIPENETHKFIWNFEIQTDHLIHATKLELVLIKK